MREAVIVEAVRTPIGRGKPITGWLNGFHATHLLALSLKGVLDRAGVDMDAVDQIIGGCVTQAGEQSCNVVRNSWLSIGNTYKVGATTVDTQCGSGQQANYMVSAFIKADTFDVGIACGVEAMSRVGLGTNVIHGPGYFQPSDWPWDTAPDQFTYVERIAKDRGITREAVDAFALSSQKKAIAARAAGHFKREILSVQAPVLGDDGTPTGELRTVDSDQGIRETSLEQLGALNPVAFTPPATRRRSPTARLPSCGCRPTRPANSASSRGRGWLPTSSSAPIRTTCSMARSTPPVRC